MKQEAIFSLGGRGGEAAKSVWTHTGKLIWNQRVGGDRAADPNFEAEGSTGDPGPQATRDHRRPGTTGDPGPQATRDHRRRPGTTGDPGPGPTHRSAWPRRRPPRRSWPPSRPAHRCPPRSAARCSCTRAETGSSSAAGPPSRTQPEPGPAGWRRTLNQRVQTGSLTDTRIRIITV